MTSHSLTAERRTDTKHSSLRSLRQSGRIPAVVYGTQTESMPVSVDAKELAKVARTGRSEVFKLKVEGSSDLDVIIKDYQRKAGEWMHVDFMHISANKPIKVRVPIDFQGTAAGTKVGGVLQHQETELEVEALPANLPSAITVDVSHMEIGDKLVAGDIQLPSGVTLVASPEELVASVTASRMATEAQAADESVAAEGEEAADTAAENNNE
ncbi:50S ribosomal protein L25 [Paenibacillus cellulositrophicus]|uniref:50S ribosomal protein L25 n=1 Tax=Paenibacillus cellulositrophicus TaxID=562959 RepID=UPI00203FFF5F|nr:50S ribosomal protein L25 [Paenibacillus cellulositrophicus]MCM2999804.1 50S ribosomal protein L25 [Paenibacillus cellulositrophicus]